MRLLRALLRAKVLDVTWGVRTKQPLAITTLAMLTLLKRLLYSAMTVDRIVKRKLAGPSTVPLRICNEGVAVSSREDSAHV